MKITTESGAIYDVNEDRGIAIKYRNGEVEDTFKYGYMKPFPEDWVEGEPVTYEWLDSLPIGQPMLGRRLYIGGYKDWWITTNVVRVETETVILRMQNEQ